MLVKLLLFAVLTVIVATNARIPDKGENEMPKSFLSQIWNWIFSNLGGTAVGQDHILRGPPAITGVPKTTLGKWILGYLKKTPPKKTMLVEASNGQKMNAGELLMESTKFAMALQKEFKIGKDDVVAVIGANTIRLNVVGFGTYISGGVMAPIDPKFNKKQMAHMLDLYEPKLVICDADLVKTIEAAVKTLKKKATIVTVQPSDGYKDVAKLISGVKDKDAKDFESPDGNPNDMAAIVHSSGGAGYPKGVGLSHYALIYQSSLFKDYRRDISWLQPSYFFWMSGVLVMIISAVFDGVPRVLVETNDPADIMDAIQKYKPGFMVVSPPALGKIVNNPKLDDYDLSSMKYISMTGGPVSSDLIKRANKVIKGSVLGNEYGITEVSGVLAYGEQPMNVTSVGKPMPGFQVKVINRKTKKSVAPDTEGEILVKGPTLFIRYMGSKKHRESAFDDEGWYYTGDLGKYTSDDILYVTGRVSEVITVNGQMILPNKIESVIEKLDGVKDVAVTGIKEGNNKLPIAVVVKTPGSKITADQIKSAVKDQLPDIYQLRGGVKFIKEIPRTSTGKVDRKKLGTIVYES